MDTHGLNKGIDFNPSVNDMQAAVDVRELQEAGHAFAWGKVSEGWGWRESASNTMNRVMRGIELDFPMGVYHFGWGGHSQRDQVDNFLRAIGSDKIARRIGLCLDVETYNGQVKMRRGEVLDWYRILAKRLGKDLEFFAYSGDWYWARYIDTGKHPPVLKVLQKEGIHVRVWSSPDAGYSETIGENILATARHIPEEEFATGFSGKGADIVQVDDACREAGLYPIDGNVTRAEEAKIRQWFNWK